MEKIKAILVDDELNSLENLKQKLTEFCPQVQIIGEFQRAEEAINFIKTHKPEVIFLDIEMPKMSGFRMLEELGEYDFDIIFTTAYNHYSIDAIRISAFDYLIKPIGIHDLQQAVSRLDQSLHSQTKEKIDILKKSLTENKSQEDKIAISTTEGIEFIPIKNIRHIESKSNYSKLYLPENKTMLVSKILKDFEEMLVPYHFYRIHNSHLINLNYIKKYIRSKGGQVMLQDGTVIDISRRKKDDFLKMISG